MTPPNIIIPCLAKLLQALILINVPFGGVAAKPSEIETI